MKARKVIIMGAAGRDFHNFNVYFRDNEEYEVVAFTATQIPDIDDRKYPAELSGKLYPDGIRIYPEEKLVSLIKENNVDDVILAYSDLWNHTVMDKASIVLAAGANFKLMGHKITMIKSKKPVISICAVRTGTGKSQTTRRVCEILKNKGIKAVAVRHPMPYGNLVAQKCQRFETYDDLNKHKCTIEEREEYEPHIDRGTVVYAGVDYQTILAEAEKEADVVVWDGGNNDMPFFQPTLAITVADPHRPDHEIDYYPGQVNAIMADVLIINKVQTADIKNVERVRKNLKKINPNAVFIDAASPITLTPKEDAELIKGKKVLVIEDGPTLTHGDMRYGAGYLAAQDAGAAEIIDPRPFAVGSIKETYKNYSHLEKILPAMGYGDTQTRELEETINNSDCDAVVGGTPINLQRIIKTDKPIVRVRYELQEITKPDLEDLIEERILSNLTKV
ncbi:MAG: cyclic 2,3-diphosphoglycerate synthase [Cyanobacteriota bacterium]